MRYWDSWIGIKCVLSKVRIPVYSGLQASEGSVFLSTDAYVWGYL
jgi:hypothetical protein